MVTRPGRVATLLAGVLALVVLASLATLTIGAEPSASPAALFEGGDPRSDGAGPGLVGSPLLILLGVVLLGILTAAATVLIVRVSQRD
jgi:hypothetical protein